MSVTHCGCLDFQKKPWNSLSESMRTYHNLVSSCSGGSEFCVFWLKAGGADLASISVHMAASSSSKFRTYSWDEEEGPEEAEGPEVQEGGLTTFLDEEPDPDDAADSQTPGEKLRLYLL